MLTPVEKSDSEVLRDAIARSAGRIAPAWPLDRSIAVNPYWGFVDQPAQDAAAAAGTLCGTRLTASREWLAKRYDAGAFTEGHIRRAAALSGRPEDAALALTALSEPSVPTALCRLMSDVIDETRIAKRLSPWAEFVIENVSSACATCCGQGQAAWGPLTSSSLYAHWRTLAGVDAGPRFLMGFKGFGKEVAKLPDGALGAIHEGLLVLGVPEAAYDTYLSALLMDVSGWASAFAFTRWEARLLGGDDDMIVELLAVRLAWEVLLYRSAPAPEIEERWSAAKAEWADLPAAVLRTQRADWLLQRAVELAYQDTLGGALAQALEVAPEATVQAVFCIDVRSEVFRRALEASDPSVTTLGFAGFFGLPVAYHSGAGPARPQLPGLLAPAIGAKDAGPGMGGTQERRSKAAALGKGWKRFITAPGSIFSAVETTGAGYVPALVKSALGSAFSGATGTVDPLRGDLGRGDVKGVWPELTDGSGAGPLSLEQRIELAAGVLQGMGLTRGFAPLVVFVGHGAGTTNNPQAAGLGCGACGGQSGELNARLLAGLLNDAEVRAGLVGRGIQIPADTHFMGGLHDTVVDEVTLFGVDEVPGQWRAGAAAFKEALAAAGHGARQERAPALGIECRSEDPSALLRAVSRRACDWSEVRPEWGLARNAAFIIAPRGRTRGKDLGGRTFLHEYDWRTDSGSGVLEAIMTAPMVVTHWINAQYNASTNDPQRFGSGDKLLHNVVGGHIGVLEGAGGDLRIGLAMQSVHDGTDWFHEPLRLTVAIEAPTASIDGIISKHEVVANLALNGWLHLTQIDPESGALSQRMAEGWVSLGG